MIRFLLFALGAFTSLISSEPSHAQLGTQYGKEGATAYALYRHGPDGTLFLDPYFTSYLQALQNKHVLDAGCGTAPWAIYAAKNGAHVSGIDLQENMISLGRQAIEKELLTSQIELNVGDVADLPYSSAFFDVALSINVGCNLPSTTQTKEGSFGLGPHVKEIQRVLKPGGICVLTAPVSFATLFANGQDRETILQHIDAVLKQLPMHPSPVEIISHLNQLTEVYRATFALVDERLCLITDESQLQPGQEIWRKIPGLTVPNRYHSEEEYVKEFEEAGLKIKECWHPQFNSLEELNAYNAEKPPQFQLSAEYAQFPAFVIFCLE